MVMVYWCKTWWWRLYCIDGRLWRWVGGDYWDWTDGIPLQYSLTESLTCVVGPTHQWPSCRKKYCRGSVSDYWILALWYQVRDMSCETNTNRVNGLVFCLIYSEAYEWSTWSSIKKWSTWKVYSRMSQYPILPDMLQDAARHLLDVHEGRLPCIWPTLFYYRLLVILASWINSSTLRLPKCSGIPSPRSIQIAKIKSHSHF